MGTDTSNIELRSKKTSSLLASRPPWIIRHGISIVFLAMALLLSAAAFVTYPKYESGTATVTNGGKVVNILIEYDKRHEIHPGQKTMVEIAGYPAGEYGYARCEITSVGTEVVAISGKNYFVATATVKQLPADITLSDGQKGTATIQTHQGSILSHLAKYRTTVSKFETED